jgi:tRNA modification GTPase
VEQIGIARAQQQVADADIVLVLSEAGGPDPDPFSSAEQPVIRVHTKRDLAPGSVVPPGEVAVSATTGEGVAKLWGAIEAAVAGFQLAEAVALGVVLNERHLHKLATCRDELDALRREVDLHEPGDEIVGTLLASILSGLGEVSGRVFSEQVLARVFARFCVGK